MKILILLFYYDRPEMVKNALKSIENSSYKNFTVAFIDDGSPNPGKPVVEEILSPENLEKVVFYNTNQSSDDKNKQGGSIFGKYANIAMETLESDITIMLCDDDALTPNYLEHLNHYYTQNPEIQHSYSKVLFYDPSKEDYTQSKKTTSFAHRGSTLYLNSFDTPIEPWGKFDASQVAWRTNCNIKFPYPQTRALDSSVCKQLGDHHGLCYPTHIEGQCKGAFADQLGNRWADGKEEYKVNIS